MHYPFYNVNQWVTSRLFPGEEIQIFGPLKFYALFCVSYLDPNLCPRGLSVEMTIKVDPEATSYREPRYILDTGASSFNSRGVSLYTIDNKLRADVAIRDTAYCLVVPLTIGKWQDVVLTYHKNGGMLEDSELKCLYLFILR